MKYRKKPVVIKAVQYKEFGELVTGMCNSQSCYVAGNTEPHVHTIHNNQLVNLEVGDYVIPEPDGIHYYPCKPDIFEKTYEIAEKTDSSLSKEEGKDEEIKKLKQQLMLEESEQQRASDIVEKQQQEIEILKQWKAEAMAVMPDFQEIGKILGVKLGEDVSGKIIPELKRLKELLYSNYRGWFISFYRNTSTMTARQIDDYMKEQWNLFAKENGLKGEGEIK